ncbi:DUF7860 family protein [Halocalculus aciditolerans]|uniref:Uncharacterized protein n=1 Tax=Halocalculus aciditolerans TaxID=1383812 RepID=A0A830F7F2_9EURY|nr:hypothetical protein [Halocalculus aciditolerans]GGL48209.1 hypothetical protein GCM10009039_03040 [Halocalculus aciditolerans]
MGRYGSIDYPAVVKTGTLASLALVAIGFAGAALGASTLPAWSVSLFTDAEAVGALGVLFVPFVFGVVLPLTE